MPLAVALPTLTVDEVWALDDPVLPGVLDTGLPVTPRQPPVAPETLPVRLTRPDHTFLDYTALTGDQHAEITAWGLLRGYLTWDTGFRIDYLDPVTGDARHVLVPDRAAAVSAEDAVEGLAALVTEVPLLTATARFPDPLMHPGAPVPLLALTAVWLAAEHPTVDGIWWTVGPEDPLSGPGGLILPARLTDWIQHPLR